jgi:hypothetical protein
MPTWSFFAEPEVSSVVMVVANVVGEKSLQVNLIESDDMLQQIALTTLNPSLRNAVLLRILERCPYSEDIH